MDDRYTIDTPENIAFAYDIAGIGSRFLATILDTLLQGVLLVILAVILGVLVTVLPNVGSGLPGQYLSFLAAGGLTLLSMAYYILFEIIWNGQSPGKRMIGVRVVRDGGRPITPI